MPTAAGKSRIEKIIDAKIAAMRANRNIPEKTRRAVIGLMLMCGLLSLSVSVLSIDIIDAIYVNFYTKIAIVFGLYNLAQEIRETLRTNKLGLPKAEYYAKYINDYRPRICTITKQLVWKQKHDVLDHQSNHELAQQLIEHNLLTSMAELQQLDFICQKSGRVMAYPMRVLRACDIDGILGRVKLDESNSEPVYRFEGSVIAEDALLLGENPLKPEQKIRLRLSGGSPRDGQGYGYKAGDIIFDAALDQRMETFFAAKIEVLRPLLERQEQERRQRWLQQQLEEELQHHAIQERGSSSSYASVPGSDADRESQSTRGLLLYSHQTTPRVSSSSNSSAAGDDSAVEATPPFKAPVPRGSCARVGGI